MSDDGRTFHHPFQWMSLEAVEIPEITSLLDLARKSDERLFIGDLSFGPHADQYVQSELVPMLLNFLSASAHSDWMRQKVILSLHGGDAEEAYRKYAEDSKKLKIKTFFQEVVERETSGALRACLERVDEDARRISNIRNLFAHGVFGRASHLEQYFLVFEPMGLTKAHAEYTTYDTNAEYPFASDPIKDMKNRFDKSLPDSDSIKVWNKEMLEVAVKACDGVRLTWGAVIESLKPHTKLRAKRNEVHEILSTYGAVTVDLRDYFNMQELDEQELQFQRRKGERDRP